jgi:hypothetical protein
MDCSIVIQTCDKYEKFWHGLFYYMDKFWDNSIDCPIYFCNENKTVKTNFTQIKTGNGSFVQNLKKILEKIETKYIFYLLEDFWPINNFSKNLFQDIYIKIIENNIKALQVSAYTPYYNLENTEIIMQNQKLMKFKQDSEWKFNFQSRFWEKDFFYNCLEEPKISESIVNSAITVEMACSEKFKSIKDEIFFYHYLWYPFSGVSYRGDFTALGKELENNMRADLFGKKIIFS